MDLLHTHLNKIKSFLNNTDKESYQNNLSELYKYVKKITNYYYNGISMSQDYKTICDEILKQESKINNQKLLITPINFNKNETDFNFIEYLVYSTRLFLYNKHTYGFYHKDFENINLTNDCKLASNYINKKCLKYNVKCYTFTIYPGYENKIQIYNGSGYHYFNIVKYINDYYLVDVTYSQFFYKNKNNLDRLGIVNLSGCNVGRFMIMTDYSKSIASKILEDGYIKLDTTILKNYLDAFTVSFRNGLYYENTNDFSYKTDYTLRDYNNFFRGLDNQINHENLEYLGYQKKPLKNWQLDFKK